MNDRYRAKVALLIEILPFVAQEADIALHGGTAINLFIRNLPRLSVDIDLTYLPIQGREETLEGINKILARLKENIESQISGTKCFHNADNFKLFVVRDGANIKLEVNTIIRGTTSAPKMLTLCERAQNEFEAFVQIPVVPFGQLYGGKLIAALDRQHPRDMFDVKHLLKSEGFTDEIKSGFIFSLVSSARPIHVLLNPNLKDQADAMSNQFDGMSEEVFSYPEYEKTRQRLIEEIKMRLTEQDKSFILSFKKLEPDWSIYKFEKFPAVQWKLHNLELLKTQNLTKYKSLVKNLQVTLLN